MDRSELVIVALPSQGDYVRKISSEVEPHLTLLYLGENDFDADQMGLLTGYVQFASSMLSQFTLEVERRGELGDKNADVLFFYKSWTKDIARFRDNLLRNDLVMTAYQSAEQYPEWTPHLTLGYPDNPAKKDPLDHREITYVTFDRIALWTGESKGATFPLKYLRYETELSMAQINQGRQRMYDVLEHYGTKGMKWGVRRDRGHEGEQATLKKIAKLDQKFERNARTIDTMIKVNNRAADLTNKNDVDRINNKPAYKDADFSRDTPLRRKYYKEHQKAFIDNLEKAADELGTNASGTKKYRIFERPDGDWDVELGDVKHDAISEDETFPVKVGYDDSGRIIKIVIPEDVVVQAEEFVTDFFAHYGIKGMRWGVRRSQSELAKQPPSDDFTAAKASAAKAKAGGIKTLSNKELKDLNERLNLEKQYKNLSKKTKSKGQKAVEELLLNVGKQEASKILSKYANKGVSNLLGNS